MLKKACLALLVWPTLALPSQAGGGRELTFADRVAAETEIQRIRHAYRIGDDRTFEQAVPPGVAERRVLRYLRQSAALQQVWGRPITAEALDRELARIARNTRYPSRLGRIYAALDDDPFLIRECLVRPVLAERWVRGLVSRAVGAGARSASWEDWWERSGASLDLDTGTGRARPEVRVRSKRVNCDDCRCGVVHPVQVLGPTESTFRHCNCQHECNENELVCDNDATECHPPIGDDTYCCTGVSGEVTVLSWSTDGVQFTDYVPPRVFQVDAVGVCVYLGHPCDHCEGAQGCEAYNRKLCMRI